MDAGTKIAAIASGVLVVAIISVLVSRNNQTASVIQAATGGFSQVLQVAMNPGGAGSLSTGLAQSLSPLVGGVFGATAVGF